MGASALLTMPERDGALPVRPALDARARPLRGAVVPRLALSAEHRVGYRACKNEKTHKGSWSLVQSFCIGIYYIRIPILVI